MKTTINTTNNNENNTKSNKVNIGNKQATITQMKTTTIRLRTMKTTITNHSKKQWEQH